MTAQNATDMDTLLRTISEQAFASEPECLQQLMPEIAAYEARWPSISERARSYITTLREDGMGVSVEAFLQEYSLSNKEGVAIMCLAEALLRIPDRATADKLIDSTFDGANWDAHIGKSESILVNASSWGLLLTGKVIEFSDNEQGRGAKRWLSQLTQHSSEPVIRNALKAAMKLVASQFVLGETIESSLKKARKFEKLGYTFSYDMLGEGARTFKQAENYFNSYKHAIEEVGKRHFYDGDETKIPSVSIKLSALHPRYEWRKREICIPALLGKLKELIKTAKKSGIRITIDAEEAYRLDLSLDLFRELYLDDEIKDFIGLGIVLQAYQKRAYTVIDFLLQLAEQTGKVIPIRLVKGAYWDTEVKRAQILGLTEYPVFTAKAHSDISYLACAKKLLDNPHAFFPQFATHNALTIAAIIEMAGDSTFEFQRLYGMGEKLFDQIRERHSCRIYAPIGEHQDLLAYLIRRLLENGANTSFVHKVLDKHYVIDDFLISPSEQLQHATIQVPLPRFIYKDARLNSIGIDIGNRSHMDEFDALLKEPVSVDSPKESAASEVSDALDRLDKGFHAWHLSSAHDRAAMLEKSADILESKRNEVVEILTFEAHKTLQDSIDEWREAIDFLRYYALMARRQFSEPIEMDTPTGESNLLYLHGRGIFFCISPWNFPLAIFTGQVAAALAAGNTVIAKPAEQTPAIAKLMLDIFREAGIDQSVFELVYGGGKHIGDIVTPDARVKGVCFTGSTATARHIQRQLCDREDGIIPLIAETGGLNCMMVDSSALLEHVIDDVMLSAFGSAGQRCSALRACFVEEHIADEFIAMLADAMGGWEIGNPNHIAHDAGPLIDMTAKERVDAHIERMKKEGKLIAAMPMDEHARDDLAFVQPHAFEINDFSMLKEEVFGPVLHVIRYKQSEMTQTIDQINSSGYGLTFGVHSRIPPVYETACEQVRAGNCYINRSMTGAVVGVQPFGGEGLSGTGPKAGGPHYLLRFAAERTITNNTAAIGGNIELLIE
ncbi:MAG: L-glutamate gamma-semialdehyde dehydrogenase [Rickettsiales bacterium]|nr:L-glutamate gamma-semialdehyde dehydrogenase [Rickettsiales bacterium]